LDAVSKHDIPTILVCPPDTVKARAGNLISLSGCPFSSFKKTDNKCASIWFTAISFFLYFFANCLALSTPTPKAGESPGPTVTPITSIFFNKLIPHPVKGGVRGGFTFSASSITVSIFSSCALLAKFGTTPPQALCISI